MRACAICRKHRVIGNHVTHRGMLKKAGGVGRRTVRVNHRRFFPNLQRVTAIMNGATRRVLVCTACLRSGRVLKKVSRRPATGSASLRPSPG